MRAAVTFLALLAPCTALHVLPATRAFHSRTHAIVLAVADGNDFDMNSAITALNKAVVLRFLAQRVSGLEERARWKDVAADSVVLTLPFEPFRGASRSSRTNDGTCDVLVGMEAIMEDARQLATFLAAAAHAHAHTLRSRSGGVALTGPTFEYAIDVQDMLLSGDKLMSPWRLVSHGLGDEGEVSVHGLLKCVFNSRTKIVAMELAYDGAALPLQLKSRLGLAVPARKRAPAPAAAVPSEDDASSGGEPYAGAAAHKRREPPPVVEGDSVSDDGETSSDAAASSLEESALLPMNPPKAKPAKSSASAPKKSRTDKPDSEASSLSVNAPMLMAMQSFPGMQGMQGFPGMLPVPLMAMMPGFDPAEFLAFQVAWSAGGVRFSVGTTDCVAHIFYVPPPEVKRGTLLPPRTPV